MLTLIFNLRVIRFKCTRKFLNKLLNFTTEWCITNAIWPTDSAREAHTELDNGRYVRGSRIAELERRIAAVRSELLSNDELLIRLRDEMARERPNSSSEVWPFIQSQILKLMHENSGSIIWRL